MKDKAVFAEMLVQQKPVRFRIDCGASANILPSKYVEDVKSTPGFKRYRENGSFNRAQRDLC